MRGVPSQQDPTRAVDRCLTGHVGESGNPGGVVDAEIGFVHCRKGLAQIGQRGLAARSDLPLSHDHAEPLSVLQSLEAVNANRIVTDAGRRLLGHLDLGDQVAPSRVPSREVDSGRFADQAATAIAPNEILRPDRRTIRQLDAHASVVLREAGHLRSVVNPYRQLGDAVGQDPFDLVLPDTERLGVTRWEIAHVEDGRGEYRGLSHLTLSQEPTSDPTLIQQFDRA